MRVERRESGRKERQEWLIFLASFSLALVALAGLHFCGVQLCLFHKYTGLPCPVCGSSRALLLLLKGRFPAAFLLQPLASLAMLAVATVCLVYSYMLLFRRTVCSLEISARERRLILPAIILLVTANWVYLLLHGV